MPPDRGGTSRAGEAVPHARPQEATSAAERADAAPMRLRGRDGGRRRPGSVVERIRARSVEREPARRCAPRSTLIEWYPKVSIRIIISKTERPRAGYLRNPHPRKILRTSSAPPSAPDRAAPIEALTARCASMSKDTVAQRVGTRSCWPIRITVRLPMLLASWMAPTEVP